MRKGMLITLEGNEGCGKTTQIKYLAAYLRRRRIPLLVTREPGGTRIGDAIRQVLLDNRNERMTALCETFLYMAARTQLVSELIRGQIDRGVVVLSDRWLDATIAYQGYGAGINVDWIRSLGRIATLKVMPRLTVFLELPLEAGLRRAKSFKPADRIESKTLAYHRKVRAGYLTIARCQPKRFKRLAIRESDTIWAVHERIKRIVDAALKSR